MGSSHGITDSQREGEDHAVKMTKKNARDCRTIFQQLVSLIPQHVLTSTSYKRKEQGNDPQKKTVTFEDQDKESEEVERKGGGRLFVRGDER